MTDTIAVIADTHVGSDTSRYMLQPSRPEWTDEVFDGVARLVAEQGVGLVVHVGDIGHAGTAAEIERTLALLGGLGAPVAACLGNHDMFGPDSYRLWREAEGEAAARGIQLADRVVPARDVDVVVLNNAWLCEGRPGWRWLPDGEVIGQLLDEQLEWLDEALGGQPDRPAVLVVHQPIARVPDRLRPDAAEVYPHPPFVPPLMRVLDEHPRVRLVLSGHYHVTYRTDHRGRVHLSTASLTELPFDVRIVRIDRRRLEVTTLPAMPAPPDATRDPEKAWSGGHSHDRDFVVTWE